MPATSTPNQLIALLYNETSPEQKNNLLEMVGNDLGLQKELNDYAETLSYLEEAEVNANPTSIAIIMEYSAKMQQLQHA